MRKFKFAFVLLAFFTLFTAYANDVVKVPADKLYDYISSLKEPGTYKIKITGLEQLDEFPKPKDYYGLDDNYFSEKFEEGNCIYIDLSETEIPDGMDMKEAFFRWFTLVASPKFLGSVMDNSLEGTFYQCYSLKKVTNLPKGVANMGSTFAHCWSLTVAPEIPDSVKSLGRCRRSPHYDWSYYYTEGTFGLCRSLAAAPKIPSSVKDMEGTFAGCRSLTAAPEIPDSVTNMNYTFEGCELLAAAPEIPDSVTNMNYTFEGCKSLTVAPEIPDSVTNLFWTFANCTSLTVVPKIPNSVQYMNFTFNGCTSLKIVEFFPDTGVYGESGTSPKNIENHYHSTFEGVPASCKIYVDYESFWNNLTSYGCEVVKENLKLADINMFVVKW